MYAQVTARIKNMAVRQAKYRKVCSPTAPPPPQKKQHLVAELACNTSTEKTSVTVSLCVPGCLQMYAQLTAKACRVNNLSITIMAVSGTKSHKVCAPTAPPPPRKNSTWWVSWPAILRQKKPATNIAHSACPSVCTVCIVPRPRGRQCQTSF